MARRRGPRVRKGEARITSTFLNLSQPFSTSNYPFLSLGLSLGRSHALAPTREQNSPRPGDEWHARRHRQIQIARPARREALRPCPNAGHGEGYRTIQEHCQAPIRYRLGQVSRQPRDRLLPSVLRHLISDRWPCPCGGTGRRGRLKINCAQARESSSLSGAPISYNDLHLGRPMGALTTRSAGAPFLQHLVVLNEKNGENFVRPNSHRLLADFVVRCFGSVEPRVRPNTPRKCILLAFTKEDFHREAFRIELVLRKPPSGYFRRSSEPFPSPRVVTDKYCGRVLRFDKSNGRRRTARLEYIRESPHSLHRQLRMRSRHWIEDVTREQQVRSIVVRGALHMCSIVTSCANFVRTAHEKAATMVPPVTKFMCRRKALPTP